MDGHLEGHAVSVTRINFHGAETPAFRPGEEAPPPWAKVFDCTTNTTAAELPVVGRDGAKRVAVGPLLPLGAPARWLGCSEDRGGNGGYGTMRRRGDVPSLACRPLQAGDSGPGGREDRRASIRP